MACLHPSVQSLKVLVIVQGAQELFFTGRRVLKFQLPLWCPLHTEVVSPCGAEGHFSSEHAPSEHYSIKEQTTADKEMISLRIRPRYVSFTLNIYTDLKVRI